MAVQMDNTENRSWTSIRREASHMHDGTVSGSRSFSVRQWLRMLLSLRLSHWQASFLSGLISLILVVQTCALPIPLAFLLISGDATPMNQGCSRKTCCTALCYLDKHGVHHCVHMHDESCNRGMSNHETDKIPILYSTAVTTPETLRLFPDFHPEGWITTAPDSAETHDPGTPAPPPK
jgi:hypothetical protein